MIVKLNYYHLHDKKTVQTLYVSLNDILEIYTNNLILQGQDTTQRFAKIKRGNTYKLTEESYNKLVEILEKMSGFRDLTGE